jgi:hypothetical protein
MKLDKKKPYGYVSGDIRARFEQDGRLFDADGDELDDEHGEATDLAKAKPGRKKKEPEAEHGEVTEPESPIDSQIAAQGL